MKKQAWILLSVAVALVLILVLKDRIPTFGGGPTWKKLDGEVTQLTLESKGKKTAFVKANGRWEISGKGQQVDPEKIKKVLEVLSTNRSFQLVTELPFLDKYNLDDSNRVVATAVSGSATRTFWVGKASPTYSHTFVMLPPSSNIYQTEGYFTYDLTQDPESFRDKTLFNFTADDIANLELKDGSGKTLVLRKLADAFSTNAGQTPGATPAKVWKDEAGKTVKNTEVGDLVANMAHLAATSFAAETRTHADAVKKPFAFQIVAKSSSKTWSLTVLQEKVGTDRQVLVNDRTEVFLLNEDTAKRIMADSVEKLR